MEIKVSFDIVCHNIMRIQKRTFNYVTFITFLFVLKRYLRKDSPGYEKIYF